MTDNEEFDFHQFDGLPDDVPDGVLANVLTPQMIAKRLVWDASPCALAEEVAKEMGLPPASEDVEEMEHREAHARLNAVGPILPYVQALTPTLAQAVVLAVIKSNSNGDLVTDSDKAEAIEKMIPSLYAGIWSMLAELLDFDLIHLPHYGFMMTYVAGGGDGE